MKALIDLAQVVNRQKIKEIDVLDKHRNPNLLVNKLYDAILDGKVHDDEDACRYLYDTTDNIAAFKDVKNRLRNKLYDTLFFIDLNQPNFNDHKKAVYELNKLWCVVLMLYDRQLTKEALHLCDKILPLALKFDETLVGLNTSRVLLTHALFTKPDTKKQKKYKKINSMMQNQIRLEISCNNIKDDFALATRSLSNLTDKYLIDIEKRIKNLIQDEEYLSEYLIKNTYQILSYIYILKKEYDQSVKVCNKAIHMLSKKPYISLKTLILFKEDLFFAHMYLRNFKIAESYILENLKQVTYEGAFYFRTYSFYSNLAAYSSNFNKLYDIVAKVINNKKLKDFTRYYEKLSIKEAYLHLLIKMGKIDEKNKEKKLRKFRLNKFLNDVPYFAKDKRGNNISILIIQMLYLIIDKKYNKAIDRIDAMKQYSYRYLRKDDSFRSNCFIKMLIIIPKQDFHPVAVQRHTNELFSRLKKEPITLSEQSANVEVIPYETLWQFTIEAMGSVLEQ